MKALLLALTAQPFNSRCNRNAATVTRWRHTWRTLFLELPMRKIPTVCRAKRRWRHLEWSCCGDDTVLEVKGSTFLPPKKSMKEEKWIPLFAEICRECDFFHMYRVSQDAGSKDPPLAAPVCRLGSGSAFCLAASSGCRLPPPAATAAGPPGAVTGCHRGRWCNPRTRHPVEADRWYDKRGRSLNENVPTGLLLKQHLAVMMRTNGTSCQRKWSQMELILNPG